MKKTTMFVFAIALFSASLRAQEPTTQWNGDGITFVGPAQDAPAHLQKIFSNLGPPTSAYVGSGFTLSGPLSALGYKTFMAIAFSSAANAHVREVRAAVQYSGSGANQVNLSLYSDNGGVPGTLMAGPVTVTNLPSFFTCCTLAVAKFPAVPITAGVRYWVVADTPLTGAGSDFEGVWALVPPLKSLVSVDGFFGWYSSPASIQEPAGSVYGTIP
jgi:hypothetical protein